MLNIFKNIILGFNKIKTCFFLVEDKNGQFKQLAQSLKRTAKSGEYVVEGQAFEMPNMLGLRVKNIGPVVLPLIDPQASELIKICKQSSYGHNKDTLTDTNVRDSYQLDPEEVKKSTL